MKLHMKIPIDNHLKINKILMQNQYGFVVITPPMSQNFKLENTHRF